MAASDYFEIVVKGKGAHGGLPHEGIDPVLIGSHIVVALQSLVSRNVDPMDSAVVSCSVFEGAKANNVIRTSRVWAATHARSCRGRGNWSRRVSAASRATSPRPWAGRRTSPMSGAIPRR